MLSQSETDFSVATENDTDEDNAKGKGCQRKSISLPSETVEYLKSWMMSPEHVAHPYPTEQEKIIIMKETGIELKQLTNWFVNNRKRYWKPRVEAKLQQKAREQLGGLSSSASVSSVVVLDSEPKHSLHTSQTQVLAPFITMNIFHAVGVQPLQIPCNTFVFPSSHVASRIRETAENSSTLVSTPCLVSDVSVSCSDSNVSEDDSNKDDTNEADISVWDNFDQATGMITRSESVDVHILRPLVGNIPSVEDVVVTYNAPLSRILRSYRNTMMEFTFPKKIAMGRQQVRNVFQYFQRDPYIIHNNTI
jgi:Homeobox KN domain